MGKRIAVPEGKQRLRVAKGVYLKPNGKYLAQFRDPGRRQHWREFATLKDAEKWRARALLDPNSIADGKRTLEEVWKKFLEHHGASLKPTTRANWEQEWRAHIAPSFSPWPVGKITTIAVKDYLAELEASGVGAPTRQKCRSILHRLFEEAVENGEVGVNPVAARGTRVKLSQPKKARILNVFEMWDLVSAAEKVGSLSDALAIETMFFLGLRIGEMSGLQARDIDKERKEIVIQRTVADAGGHLLVQEATKTNKYRVIPVPEELPLWGKLLSHVHEGGLIGAAHVFTSRDHGVIRPNNWRRRVWSKAMVEAKIVDPPSPHSGRRTTASLLSSAGVPAPTVQAILGHSTLQQTGEYIDVPEADMRAGLSRLGALYSGA
jgi:integrase